MNRLEPSYIISETVHFLEVLSEVKRLYIADLWYLNIFTEKAMDHPEIFGDCRKVYEEIQKDLGGRVILENYYEHSDFEPGKYLDELRKYKGE